MKLDKTSMALISLIAVFAVLALVNTLTSSSKAGLLDYTNSKVVAQGKQLYDKSCASCHGRNLEGEPNWRVRKPDGKLPAPPHNAEGHTWHHPDQVLIRLTKKGVGGPDYASDMPAYEGTLSDEEIIAILSYIKSTWSPDIQKRHDAMQK